MLYTLLTLSSLILSNLAANCCIDAPDAATCGDVASTPCMWIEDDSAAMALSSNIPCVSESWYECEVNKNCPIAPPPKPPVPPQCVFDACSNVVDVFNIGFVIDESGSVGSKNYFISLDFVEKMLENDINDISPISMLAYSYDHNMDVIYTFNQYAANGKHGALAALQAETYNGGMTATGTAMRKAVDEYQAVTSPHDNNILFLMTDGHPNEGLNVCDAQLLADIDSAGIEVYIVGISGGFSKTKVECLVKGNDEYVGNGGDKTVDDYVISIPSFSQQLFYHIEAQLRRVVCPAQVFKAKNDINNLLFVSDSAIINNMNNNMIYYIVGLVLLICGGLIYYFKTKICKKNEKYIALNDDKQTQYQSV